MGRAADERGQAAAELVAVVPLLLLLFLAVAQLAVAGFALWSAGDAARAGARAAHVGGDARAAALSALPGWLERGARIERAGRLRSASRHRRCFPGFRRSLSARPPSSARGRGPVAEIGRPGCQRGQASIELLAAIPFVFVAALVCMQLLAAGYALTLADGAAEAGAIALASGLPAGPAVDAALPGWARDRVDLERAADGCWSGCARRRP